jgi:hypothetical protein
MRIDHDEPRFACSGAVRHSGRRVEFSFERFTDGQRRESRRARDVALLLGARHSLYQRTGWVKETETVVMTWRYELSSGGRRLRATERIRGGSGRDPG